MVYFVYTLHHTSQLHHLLNSLFLQDMGYQYVSTQFLATLNAEFQHPHHHSVSFSAWYVSFWFLWAAESVADPNPSRCFRRHCHNHPPWRMGQLSFNVILGLVGLPLQKLSLQAQKKILTSKISRDKGSLFGDLCSCNLNVLVKGGMLLWKRVTPPQDLEWVCSMDQDVWTVWSLPFCMLCFCVFLHAYYVLNSSGTKRN